MAAVCAAVPGTAFAAEPATSQEQQISVTLTAETGVYGDYSVFRFNGK